MSAFTPGPWHVGVKQAGVIVYNAEGWAIADAVVYHGQHEREECKANARLIAAAPELLAALEALIPMVEEFAVNPELDNARAIVRRARGES